LDCYLVHTVILYLAFKPGGIYGGGTGFIVQCSSGVPCHYHSANNTCSSSSSYSYHKDKRAKLGDLAKRSSLGT
jgi:hypothetical protein